MRDALRAMRVVPGLRAALAVHLVDKNETLRAVQQATLADSRRCPAFYRGLEGADDAVQMAAEPTILIANEFLDALPVYQFEYVGGKWRRTGTSVWAGGRSVGLRGRHDLHRHARPTARTPRPRRAMSSRPPPSLASLRASFCERERSSRLPLLFHRLRAHEDRLGRYASGHRRAGSCVAVPCAGRNRSLGPGRFRALCRRVPKCGARYGRARCRRASSSAGLGIMERASRLMAANPDKALAIETGVARLMAPSGMGSRFKAIGSHARVLRRCPDLPNATLATCCDCFAASPRSRSRSSPIAETMLTPFAS